MNKALQYTWLEFKVLLRIPIGLFFTLLFPIMLLAVIVAMSGNQVLFGDVRFVDVYLPIAMLIGMFSSGIISFSITVAFNRQDKIWLSYRLRGFRISQIIASQLLVNVVLCAIGSILVVAFAVIVYQAKLPSPETLAAFLPIWLLSACSVFMIGFVVGVCCKQEKTAQALATPLMFVFMIASGLMAPLSIFPEAVVAIVQYLPTTQANWMLTSFWIGAFSDDFPIIWWVSACWIALSVAVVAWRLRKDKLRRY